MFKYLVQAQTSRMTKNRPLGFLIELNYFSHKSHFVSNDARP